MSMTATSSNRQHRKGNGSAEPSSRRGKRVEESDTFLARQREHLVDLRTRNEARAEESRADLAGLAEQDGPDEVQFDDESGEGGNKLVDMDRERTVVGLAQVTIEDIDWALAKIDHHKYGRCEHCGGAIPRARLEALPAARLCVECKGSPRGSGLSSMRKRRGIGRRTTRSRT
ncbi:MAG TPA: TraR/DksA C4-type zinc finger protein [Acidimicrobiales bacterium]|nr:TraR/DksA C4-type zinc finger protein [Acidimicrobiales bacterium]